MGYILYFFAAVLLIIWIIGYFVLDAGSLMHLVPTVGFMLLLRTKIEN